MKLKILLLITALLLLSNFVLAQEEKTCIYFFYGEGCPHCANVHPVINELAEKFDIDMHQFEIYHNTKNGVLLNSYFEAYNVAPNKRGVPVVFIGNTYLIGDKPIINNIENKITGFKGASCPSLEDGNGTGVGTGAIGPSLPTEKVEAVSLITVIGAAFVDSINPCAIAVLIILLASVFLLGKKRAFVSGLAFIASVYIIYFLFGLGIFSAFKAILVPIAFIGEIIKYLVGGFAIIIGLLNIKDFLWYRAGGFAMEIPVSWRPRMKKLLRKATSPISAFVVGFFVSAFELPCTGGPYFFALAYLADKASMNVVIPILLLYNFIFVLPLIIINILMYLGITNIEKASDWKDKNIKLLHLITGLIMLGLGLFVIFWI